MYNPSKGNLSDINNVTEDETRAASTANLMGKSLLDRPPLLLIGSLSLSAGPRKQVSSCAMGRARTSLLPPPPWSSGRRARRRLRGGRRDRMRTRMRCKHSLGSPSFLPIQWPCAHICPSALEGENYRMLLIKVAACFSGKRKAALYDRPKPNEEVSRMGRTDGRLWGSTLGWRGEREMRCCMHGTLLRWSPISQGL